MTIDDIRKLCTDKYIYIVLSDNSYGFIEWIIRWRTRGNYNHSMWFIKDNSFASQESTYKVVPLEKYLKKGNRIKFLRLNLETIVQKKLITASIEKKLNLPIYKKVYDYLGIFGQAIGMKWMNIPCLEYCSEDVVQHLRYISKFIQNDEFRSILRCMNKHMNPEDINAYTKKYPQWFTFIGVWDYDLNNNKEM